VSTFYDVVTVALFAGLAVLFLHRSSLPNPRDRMVHYLPPAAGCALGNWLGNEHQDLTAIVVILGSIAYTIYVLKPFGPAP
jgi:hypothetical protein